jgi:hypothetical protein
MMRINHNDPADHIDMESHENIIAFWKAENTHLKAELEQAKQREARLRAALSALCHEVSGALYMRSHDMREVIGNTNFAVLQHKKNEAEKALQETQ